MDIVILVVTVVVVAACVVFGVMRVVRSEFGTLRRSLVAEIQVAHQTNYESLKNEIIYRTAGLVSTDARVAAESLAKTQVETAEKLANIQISTAEKLADAQWVAGQRATENFAETNARIDQVPTATADLIRSTGNGEGK